MIILYTKGQLITRNLTVIVDYNGASPVVTESMMLPSGITLSPANLRREVGVGSSLSFPIPTCLKAIQYKIFVELLLSTSMHQTV